jgi:hypothetical protein
VEIRRAILLFAIVLGLAALVTSFTRPAEQEEEPDSRAAEPREPSSRDERGTDRTAGSATGAVALRFEAGADPRLRTLKTGRAASLVVDVLAPGQVAIENLGLDGSALPSSPARFDVLIDDPGRHAISFTPANGADGRTIGVLRVRE